MTNSLDRTWAMWAAVAAMGMGLGCNGGHDGAPLVAHERITHAPQAPRMAVVPLVAARGAHAAPPTYAAPIANASVDARVLLITANGTDAAFAAIQNTLAVPGDAVRRAQRDDRRHADGRHARLRDARELPGHLPGPG